MQIENAVKTIEIRKRDGKTLQPFDEKKIERAVRGAWGGVGEIDERTLNLVVLSAATDAKMAAVDGVVDIEDVQNLVEIALMRNRQFEVAKAYILYREKRAEARSARKSPDPKAVSDYIHAAKYARYRPEWKRREVYEETVARTEAMHIRRFPLLTKQIREAFDLVREQRVLPSMRSMQFGGEAIEAVENRIYNCSATHVDRVEAFSQAFYLLLCGCGVGYSVQFEHVDKLPPLARVDEKTVVHHIVADSIEGWAEAARMLIQSYVDGVHVEFAYHLIRQEGAPLRTSGGKAPGHLPLKRALESVRRILDEAQGRQLRPVECHEVMCLLADAVLSGGIRRSSLIALFSLEDSEMMYLKTGDWFSTRPWLANANNSAVLHRGEVKEAQFMRIFQMTRQFGEPGFIFVNDKDEVTNPCAEIRMNCRLTITHEVMQLLKKRAQRGKPMPNVRLGEVYTGFSFCNLCEINAQKVRSLSDFIEAARAAALIGTLQAAHTNMPYLGWVSEVIAEREALLGIGMTGMMDSPDYVLHPAHQRDVAARIVEWNAEYAQMIGIRPAARTTTVKPSGTTSLALGCVSSGIHPQHSRRFIRRVTANELETTFQHFKSVNPHMCVRKPDGDWVIEFPVEAPEGARIKADFSAVQFMDVVKSTQENWVATGTARPESSPGYVHNVSNTVHVRDEEWTEVAEYLWQNKGSFSGVSFIPHPQKVYPFLPFEEIVTEADEARWNQLLAHYKPVDYLAMVEEEDATNFSQEPACASGACENPNFGK